MKAKEIWYRVFDAGAAYGIIAIGLAGSRDTLRIRYVAIVCTGQCHFMIQHPKY